MIILPSMQIIIFFATLSTMYMEIYYNIKRKILMSISMITISILFFLSLSAWIQKSKLQFFSKTNKKDLLSSNHSSDQA